MENEKKIEKEFEETSVAPPPTYAAATSQFYPYPVNENDKPMLYPAPNSPVIVVYQQPNQSDAQQTVYVHQMPPDYLGWSIFNVFCCCWCLGIIALIYSCKTRSTISMPSKLVEYSEKALTFNKWATGLGLFLFCVNIILRLILTNMRHV